jgi:hypothetical protein
MTSEGWPWQCTCTVRAQHTLCTLCPYRRTRALRFHELYVFIKKRPTLLHSLIIVVSSHFMLPCRLRCLYSWGWPMLTLQASHTSMQAPDIRRLVASRIKGTHPSKLVEPLRLPTLTILYPTDAISLVRVTFDFGTLIKLIERKHSSRYSPDWDTVPVPHDSGQASP